MEIVVVCFLFWVNVITYWTYAQDKRYAYYGKRRVPEWLMIGLSFIGGGYGALSAMLLFRHKTLHKLFTIGVPVSILLWGVLLLVVSLISM